jgi:hypothetical protein
MVVLQDIPVNQKGQCCQYNQADNNLGQTTLDHPGNYKQKDENDDDDNNQQCYIHLSDSPVVFNL